MYPPSLCQNGVITVLVLFAWISHHMQENRKHATDQQNSGVPHPDIRDN